TAEGTPERIVENWKQQRGKVTDPAPVSHTAEVLGDVLAAGPCIERQKYDPFAETAPRDGDLEVEQVGQDASMPWQSDGRRWHTHDRVTNKGTPCRWEGEILNWTDDRVHALGSFSPTNWNH